MRFLLVFMFITLGLAKPEVFTVVQYIGIVLIVLNVLSIIGSSITIVTNNNNGG